MINPLTVELHLSTPLGGFPQAATQPIAPAHLLEGIPPDELPDDPFGTQPVGSGPFHLRFLVAARAMLAADTPIEALPPDAGGPNFSTPRPTDSLAGARPTPRGDVAVPYLSSLEFRYYDDVNSLRADWDAGELDAASGLQPADARALAGTTRCAPGDVSRHDAPGSWAEPASRHGRSSRILRSARRSSRRSTAMRWRRRRLGGLRRRARIR